EEKSKTRLYVYRYNGEDASKIHALAQFSTDTFVRSMYDQVADPKKESAFPYDFSMNPYNDQNAYFCTSVTYQIYRPFGSLNPYDPANWSQISGSRESLMSILGLSAPQIP